MQQGDYTTPYYYPPNPPIPTTDLHHPPFNHASAPPFSTTTTTTTPSYHPPLPNPNPQFDASQPPYNPPYDHYSSSPYHNNNNNNPTQFPTHSPSPFPTHSLSQDPSHFPTQIPSQFPTQLPSQVPTQFPSQSLNQAPSQSLSQDPVHLPSQFPSQFPSQSPSQVYDTGYGGNYGGSISELGGVGYYGKRPDMGNSRFESSVGTYDGYGGNGYGEGVYAYQGGKVEPYGSRGTGPKSSTWKEQVLFDDFGRPIGMQGKGKESGSGVAPKIVKAVPKAETREDVKGGVQKFRVKLLAESGGQSTMDVLCQRQRALPGDTLDGAGVTARRGGRRGAQPEGLPGR
ncbi:hypothetical protein M8C21_032965 [Ambrosia artemisiifolia]|uniref:Uncharacterized protein n=1 Tax=Ambrosia artemisiifolia TaxID=4212 RepID=A0AAD5GR38_AMBAR|nr:hypothetical protein M8C21_032965 [Ambrosia artemisiifolia]